MAIKESSENEETKEISEKTIPEAGPAAGRQTDRRMGRGGKNKAPGHRTKALMLPKKHRSALGRPFGGYYSSFPIPETSFSISFLWYLTMSFVSLSAFLTRFRLSMAFFGRPV